MRVCGVEIKGSDAVLVILEGTKDKFEIVKTETKKISLDDNEDSDSVGKFFESVKEFLVNNKVDITGIKKRNTKGKFAGGSVSFKIEALIQLAFSKSKLVAGATILKNLKKHNVSAPDSLLKYQVGAFETCFSLLCEI